MSVNIGPSAPKKSDGTEFKAPQNGFTPIQLSNADYSWKNPTTGNTIAYQSLCGSSSDLSLEAISEDLFAGFDQVRTLHSERKPFDGREALDSEKEGKVDGVTTRVRALIYKKNQCTYILTFASLPHKTGTDPAEFDKFISSFKAP